MHKLHVDFFNVVEGSEGSLISSQTPVDIGALTFIKKVINSAHRDNLLTKKKKKYYFFHGIGKMKVV